MSDSSANENVVYWPRVKEILDGVMERWIQRWGREPYPGIHEYYWDTPQHLSESVLFGRQLIEPGVPGRESQLILSLTRGVGTTGKMPLRGPFLSRSEVDEIVSWIDTGMPRGPEDRK